MILSDLTPEAHWATSHVLVQSPKSHSKPAKFWKHSKVVWLGFFSPEARNSDRLKPNSTPQMSAKIIQAASIVILGASPKKVLNFLPNLSRNNSRLLC